MIVIRLNSFVHRVPDKALLITQAAKCGCQLKRIRRSRNWQLSGEEAQLKVLIALLIDEAHQWIVKEIDKALPKPEICLASLIEKTPSVTVNQLVAQTGCTMSDARQAIDQYEGFD